MSTKRQPMPQPDDKPFITDGGLETTLIFDHGFDLPEVAAFDLLGRPGGYETLRDYYLPYIEVAREHGLPFILESATWRASSDWGCKLGYSSGDLRDVNRKAITLLGDLRREYEDGINRMLISGCIGPRGDGYTITGQMSADEARAYHREQITTIAGSEADMVAAFTINYAQEAVGIAQAAVDAGIPAVIGFTVETDGRLPSGQGLGEAIETVDRATGHSPAYYMINCAHPTHFDQALNRSEAWVSRVRALRPNASSKSHADLDAAHTLDAGDPLDLGKRCAELADRLPHIKVFGGCCGTGPVHVEQIGRALVGA